ncbi:uncharacterized protein E6C27_scaffold102G00430 [Cucumis melo var. makuwa]|uniref:Uncharacterized protein n=1 Tax=Cucumis melo var. makuwa TaxID=1194695 RepID=A0A5A7UBY4_CUCMM|nr:uncharacterized protein E6C27_scaffold102G00430 [Cucumis melo var. makuwa]
MAYDKLLENPCQSIEKAKRTNHQVMLCGVCGLLGHPTNKCPEITKEVNAMGSFNKRLAPNKKDASKDEELLEVFKKEQINLSLLSAIQQISRNAKFLKELCANKRKAKGQGSRSVEFDGGDIVSFNIFDAMTFAEEHFSFVLLKCMMLNVDENVDEITDEIVNGIVTPSIDYDFDKLDCDEITFSPQE